MLKRSLSAGGFTLFPVAIIAGILFAAVRAIGTIGPPAFRFILPGGFVVMALMPLVFLDKRGWRKVGFVKSNAAKYYVYAIISGAVLGLLCYGLGLWLFDLSNDNWFVSIKNSYLRTFDTTGIPARQLLVVFTIPALIFSPIGEEIFFRGFLQEALASKFSDRNAMIIDSLFFALIHLFHHGIIKDSVGTIHFYPLSGFMWVLLMFVTAMAFALLKKKSGSIYPAILSHAIFNLVMNIAIFYGMG